VHIERCEGRKRCRWCLGAFKDAVISMHTEECKKKFRVCRKCKKSGIPIEALEAHLEACPFKRCHRCDTTVLTLDWEKHSKACQLRRCSGCRKTKILDLIEHRRMCKLTYCSRCYERRITDLDGHNIVCQYFRCNNCKRARILLQDVEAHLNTCLELKICRHCNERFRAVDVVEHSNSCSHWRCDHCRLSFSLHEVEAHLRTCQSTRCYKCNARFSKPELPHICAHFKCKRCGRQQPLNQFEEHMSTCQFVRCGICHMRFSHTSIFEDHQGPCAERSRAARYQATSAVKNTAINRQVVAQIRQDLKVELTADTGTISKGLLSAMLLNSKSCYPQSPAIKRVMDAWTKTPHNVVIADFEYSTRLLSTMKHECVFEIALANANGDWIVPPTSINHKITISELFQKGVAYLLPSQGDSSQHNHTDRIHRFRSQIAKYYGSSNKSETPGLSWEEIAEAIADYIKVAFLYI
jgi:hypothetical protein